jgi:hypothetical protein
MRTSRKCHVAAIFSFFAQSATFIMIFALAMASASLTAEEPWRRIGFTFGPGWSVTVFEDGGAAILVGDEDFLKTRAGTFQMAEIQRKWSPFIVDSIIKDAEELSMGIQQGDAKMPEVRRAYLTNVQLAKDLITEAIQKGEVPDKGSVDGFNRFLRKNPLGISGLQLRDDQYATDRHLNAFGPDQELPKPPGDKPGKNEWGHCSRIHKRLASFVRDRCGE